MIPRKNKTLQADYYNNPIWPPLTHMCFYFSQMRMMYCSFQKQFGKIDEILWSILFSLIIFLIHHGLTRKQAHLWWEWPLNKAFEFDYSQLLCVCVHVCVWEGVCVSIEAGCTNSRLAVLSACPTRHRKLQCPGCHCAAGQRCLCLGRGHRAGALSLFPRSFSFPIPLPLLLFLSLPFQIST